MITLFKKIKTPLHHNDYRVKFYSADLKFNGKNSVSENILRDSHPCIHDIVLIDSIPYYYNVNLTTKQTIKLYDDTIVNSQTVGITPFGKNSNAVVQDAKFIKISDQESAARVANSLIRNYLDNISTVDQNKTSSNIQQAIKNELNKDGFDDGRINFPYDKKETCNELAERIRQSFMENDKID